MEKLRDDKAENHFFLKKQNSKVFMLQKFLFFSFEKV